jgi:hypothetical protein
MMGARLFFGLFRSTVQHQRGGNMRRSNNQYLDCGNIITLGAGVGAR